MRRWALLLSLLVGVLVAGCATGNDKAPKPAAATAHAPTTKVIPAPVVTASRVPGNLVGTTMGDAKAVLARAGFTHVVAAGGSGVTDASTVTDVDHAGQAVPPSTAIVLTGAAPEPVPTTAPDAATSESVPTIGAECGVGDEQRYDVCAGHKAWVDGQVEFANCTDSGGSWDIPTQSCVHEPTANEGSAG